MASVATGILPILILVGPTQWELEDRTAMSFTLSDQPGILHQALQVFTKHKINLTSLQSKPKMIEKQAGRTIDFYVDFEGRETDP